LNLDGDRARNGRGANIDQAAGDSMAVAGTRDEYRYQHVAGGAPERRHAPRVLPLVLRHKHPYQAGEAIRVATFGSDEEAFMGELRSNVMVHSWLAAQEEKPRAQRQREPIRVPKQRAR
jgi:hypothetical protein